MGSKILWLQVFMGFLQRIIDFNIVTIDYQDRRLNQVYSPGSRALTIPCQPYFLAAEKIPRLQLWPIYLITLACRPTSSLAF
jgi:hypothetical protein